MVPRLVIPAVLLSRPRSCWVKKVGSGCIIIGLFRYILQLVRGKGCVIVQLSKDVKGLIVVQYIIKIKARQRFQS